MDKEYIDLYTLMRRLKRTVEEFFPERMWVKAEIASVSRRTNGHCYLDLCQNDPSGKPVAQTRAAIWRSQYSRIAPAFEAATGSPLQAGMSVLLSVQLSYSELYGLTLSVDDIDPQFTIGEKELEKKRTIARLTEENLIGRQQTLDMTALPYRLAVISSGSAAGYGDFCRHLESNPFGFVFAPELFPAVMQGLQAPASIIGAIDAVEACAQRFDAVLIIRGGGSEMDLSCFDDYSLCRRIAVCDIPVLTAIGHERDFHVADMAAYRHVKTPTALADEFIDCYEAEDQVILSFSTRLRLAFVNKINLMRARTDMMESRIHAADPRNILSRGYVLVSDGAGKVLKTSAALSRGDEVRVLFSDGTLVCDVKKKL